MITDTPVNLRQDRDFGEVFNATFLLIKQNLSVLARAILFFVAPVAIVGAVIFGSGFTGMFASITQLETDPMRMLRFVPSMLGGGLVMLASSVLLMGAIYGVLRLHERVGPGGFTPVEAFRAGVPYLPRVFGFSVLLFLAAVVSALINVIPCLGTIAWLVGLVYVGTRLSLATPAYVLDDYGLTDGAKVSWDITRDAFWQTLGVLFVTYLVASILGQAFQLPLTIYTQTRALTSSDPEAMLTAFSSPWIIVYTAFSTLAQQFLYVVPFTALGLQYGNLSESVTQAGVLSRLDTFAAPPPADGDAG